MFQKKTVFLSATLASILSLYDTNAFACTSSGPGKYCYYNKEYTCEEDCYCKGGTNVSLPVDVRVACLNPGMENDRMEKLGAKRCPADFRRSDKGAKTEDDCYNYDKDGKKAYYIWYSCPAGQYFPANSITCQPCKTGYKCPGVRDLFSKTKDRGIESCPSGYTSNSSGTDCVKSSIKCNPGKYLPANNTSLCLPCKDRYYCPGGSFSVASFDQGLKSCPSNQEPNSAKTSCIAAPVKCDPGKYLPANASKCTSCKDRYYCPGGMFKPSNVMDRGLISCPSGKVPNTQKTACIQAIKCDAGKYLPANATSCSACQDRYYCPGGSFIKMSVVQGLKTCPSNKQPNAGQTACEYKDGSKSKPEEETVVAETNQVNEVISITCDAGLYLPAGSTGCVTCTSGNFACAGGIFNHADYDQGIVKCSETQAPNQEKTNCENLDDQTRSCDKGYYLPAKTIKCAKCPSNMKNYCPGGVYTYNTQSDQGVYVCPSTSVANSGKNACVLTLNKDFLKNGPANADASLLERCWTKIDSAEYRTCLFGNTLKLGSD